MDFELDRMISSEKGLEGRDHLDCLGVISARVEAVDWCRFRTECTPRLGLYEHHNI